MTKPFNGEEGRSKLGEQSFPQYQEAENHHE
jgi:hypothetical protein